MHSTSLLLPADAPAVETPDVPVRVTVTEQWDGDAVIQVLKPRYLGVKASAEYVGAAVLLVLLLPVVIVAAAATKLTSRGPAFYRQTRVGRGGRAFRIWKVRTMVHDAESGTGAVWSQKGDPRVTRVGWFLRATHIDEFPQLLNVLSGDMALIGPRPERPEFVSHLEWKLPGYRQRLRLRPGITGLAQLLLPPDSGLESVREKLVHDLYYVRHVSLWLDLRIAVHTVSLLGGTFWHFATRPLRLPKGAAVRQGLPETVLESLTLGESGLRAFGSRRG